MILAAATEADAFGATGLMLAIVSPAIVWFITDAWCKVRRAEYRAIQSEAEAKLKIEMVQRGMSAEEIERVLRASKEPAEAVESA